MSNTEVADKKITTMTGKSKQAASRAELKERIIDTAVKMFIAYGIKAVKMDDIAASLGISKRTLYEVFGDKESLLESCIQKRLELTEAYFEKVLAESGNVLESILKFYLWTIERYHETNRKFYEDLKKYPGAYEKLKNDKRRNGDEVVQILNMGVEQGLFRSDVNFTIQHLLMRELFDFLMESDVAAKFSFEEVYEAIMFTTLRGISTEKGAAELEKFIRGNRKA